LTSKFDLKNVKFNVAYEDKDGDQLTLASKAGKALPLSFSTFIFTYFYV